MNLNELQATADLWIRESAGGYWDKFQILAHLTEELGEVASALQRQEGLSPRWVAVDLSGEVGDLLFTLAVFANVTGINLEESIRKVIEKHHMRDAEDWQRKRADG
ncbi:MAG: MazG nucleotide pyrophosphohydrolase domain-containing protein [Pyrinomonadaceae bacterium]